MYRSQSVTPVGDPWVWSDMVIQKSAIFLCMESDVFWIFFLKQAFKTPQTDFYSSLMDRDFFFSQSSLKILYDIDPHSRDTRLFLHKTVSTWNTVITTRVYLMHNVLRGSNHCLVTNLCLCLTLCYPMDCSLPGSSVRGISQARILEKVVISFSRESSWPKNPVSPA